MGSRTLAQLLGSGLILCQFLFLLFTTGALAPVYIFYLLYTSIMAGKPMMTWQDWPYAAWPVGMVLAGVAWDFRLRWVQRWALAIGALLLVSATTWVIVRNGVNVRVAAAVRPFALTAGVCVYRVVARWPHAR